MEVFELLQRVKENSERDRHDALLTNSEACTLMFVMGTRQHATMGVARSIDTSSLAQSQSYISLRVVNTRRIVNTEPNQSYNDYSLPRPLESNCPTLLGFRTEQPFRLLEQGTCSSFHPHPVQPTVQVGSNARLPDRQGGSCEREWGSSKIQYASCHLERQRKQRMYPGYRRYLRFEVE